MSFSKTKILIFDTSQIFYKYFKKTIPNCEFQLFSEYNIKEDLDECAAAIFIIDNMLEFVEFLKVYKTNIPKIVGCYEKGFFVRRLEIEQSCGIKIIDMSGTKMDIGDQIKFCLEEIQLKTKKVIYND